MDVPLVGGSRRFCAVESCLLAWAAVTRTLLCLGYVFDSREFSSSTVNMPLVNALTVFGERFDRFYAFGERFDRFFCERPFPLFRVPVLAF